MCRSKSLAAQKHHVDRVKAKSEEIIDRRKLGEEGHKEMEMLINSQQYTKHEKRTQTIRDEIIQKAINFALSYPVTGICTVGDIKILPRVIAACESFCEMPAPEKETMIAQGKEYEPLFA